MCHNNYKSHWLTAISVIFATLSSSPCLGRESVVKGTIEARESYDSNTNRTLDNKVSAWETRIAPTVTFDSRGATDAFLLAYSPSYNYNHENHNEDINHYLRVSEHAQSTSHWRFELSETYIQTNDAAEEADTAQLNSTKLRRNRFSNNIANINSTVIFGPSTSFGLGYTNTILANDTEGQVDYTRHESTANYSWQISPPLQANISYQYSFGDFDTLSTLTRQNPAQPQDIETHIARISLGFSPTLHSKISASYQFNETKFIAHFDLSDREPYKIHSGNLRFDQAVTSTTNFGLFFGPSLVERQNSEDENDYNYGFELSNRLRNGTFLISGLGGIDQLYFNGTNDGLSIYWSAMSSLNYQLTEKLRIAISGSIRRDKFIDQQPRERETNYAGRLELAYAWQWLTASLSSQYYEIQNDTAPTATDTGYSGYRFYCTLSASKDLLHWL